MKTPQELLALLREMGVVVTVEDDRLRVNAPKGVVTAEWREALSDQKAAIVDLLRQGPPSTNLLPLSQSQQRLWFLAQFDLKNPVYNVAVAMRLIGNLDRAALELSLQAMLERHESLRTSFHAVGGRPGATVAPYSAWRLEFEDLSLLSLVEAAEEAARLATLEARKPFNLEVAPLLRARLVQIAARTHLLVLVVHHIVADGWSLGIIAKELGSAYAAFVEHSTPSLPVFSLQFRDYVRWEQALGPQLVAAQLPFWLDRLSGTLPIIELPADHLRPAVQNFNGRRVAVAVPMTLAAGLRTLCRETGTTPFMLLLAAFKVLVFRYTGIDDVLVGSSTSNRHRDEFAALVGFFVNNLVLRTSLAGEPDFRELLSRVQETALSAYAHQEIPFNLLVERLQPERSMSHSPLVQVTFNLQNVPMQPLSLPGLIVEPQALDAGIARADLAVEIWPDGEGYRCDFEYSTSLFDEVTIGQMQTHYLRILDEVVRNPGQPIGQIPLMSSQEREQALIGWNGMTPDDQETPLAGAELPFASFPEGFGRQVERSPHATAVQMHDESLTYQELDERSVRLSRRLSQRLRELTRLGGATDRIVGIYLDRSIEMVVAVLAVLRAGAAYLPLDPAMPQARLEYIVSDAAVSLILTKTDLESSRTDGLGELLFVDQLEVTDLLADSDIETLPSPESLAYVIYTSGSTGKPKGTEITHFALANLLFAMLRKPGLSASDTLVAVTTLSFDIATLEILGPLVCGAKLVLASREQLLDPPLLASLLDASGATVMQATPSTWRMLVESGWMGQPDLRIWCGGEPLPSDLAEALVARGRELWNLYGPTETTIWSTAHLIRDSAAPITIGRPIANTRTYILDEAQQPVPAGVTGELYIAGAGLARGYRGRPELTASRFLLDRLNPQSGARMYRTGDVARHLRDGSIQLLGRLDDQIKLRGHRIELGEIECLLGTHPLVGQAVAVVHGNANNQQLVVFIRSTGEGLDLNELRSWAIGRLPDYMVPAIFLPIATMPMTHNGKVDRKHLPTVAAPPRVLSTHDVRPRNETERTVASVWSEVLGREPIGMQENFFDLGGHSMLLMRVHAQLRILFDPDISVVDLFRHPTVETMASWLERRRAASQVNGVAS